MGIILAVLFMLAGFVFMIKDAHENGIGFVICEIIGIIILAALGL